MRPLFLGLVLYPIENSDMEKAQDKMTPLVLVPRQVMLGAGLKMLKSVM